MVHIKADENYRSLAGIPVTESQLEEYKQYRRYWMEYPANFFVRDFPVHLDIETTSRCNLKCIFCDRQPSVSKGMQGDIDIKLFKKIIDEGSRHNLCSIKLNVRGEPLLHKNIVEMAAYAKEKGVLDVAFNTNGMLLNESLCRGFIDARLNRLTFSIQGSEPVSLENKRIGAKFDLILKNIKTLLRVRSEGGLDFPKIRIQAVNLPDLNIEAYKTFWRKYADEVALVDFQDGTRREQGLICDWACPQLWQRMAVYWDGTIQPCCNSDFGLFALGNARKDSIFDCWHSKIVEKVRLLHRKGKSHKVKACDGCPWRTAQLKKIKSRLK